MFVFYSCRGEEFRKDLGKIGEEISSLFPSVPVMVFTATAPPKIQKCLIQKLHLKNVSKIVLNPDRTNIEYVKIKRPASMHTEDHLDITLHQILQQLENDRLQYPMTILYTDMKTISYAYAFFDKYMGDKQYEGEKKPHNRIFAQYHQVYPESMKKFIVEEICKEHSTIRLIFATVALGMGLDSPHIRHVIHYKPPTSLEKFFQETGRAGRDGLPAKSTLYFNKTDIRSNRPGITQSMIDYCRNESVCSRRVMLKYFGHEPAQNGQMNCCCICTNHNQ